MDWSHFNDVQRVFTLWPFSFSDKEYNSSYLHNSSDYTEGAELVDSVLDVVRKEAEGTDCLQGMLFHCYVSSI